MLHYTIGIAGHIDHGKTTLTKALTGIETDRLNEEKERNISIETGYAHFSLSNGEAVGVVDVPGHERFIRQMIAGSAGIDLVLLLVAADEGVMPQTREHLDILQLLGVKKGIVVISKKELVEEEFLSLVEQEVHEIVRGTFLEYASIIPISAKTGEGIARLIEEIEHSLANAPGKAESELFRMPIDRVFSIKGSGTVVTGTIFEGKIEIGDLIRLLPQDKMVRVRGIQIHHEKADRAYAGQRTALNLTGVDHHEVARGDVLVAPAFLESTKRIDVEVQLLPAIDVVTKHRSRVAVYSGTAEVEGMLLFFDRTEANPGNRLYAQLLVDDPIVVKRGDQILLRRPTPALTIGGGKVINAYGKKYPFRIETTDRLEKEHSATIGELLLNHLRHEDKSILSLLQELTLSWENINEDFIRLLNKGDIVFLSNQLTPDFSQIVSHAEHIKDNKEAIITILSEFHRDHPSQIGIKRSECKARLQKWLPSVFDWIVEQLLLEGKIKLDGEKMLLASFQADLPAALKSKAVKILNKLLEEGREVSDWLQLATEVGLQFKQAEEIRHFYVYQGKLINMNEKWVWSKKIWEESIQLLKKSYPETVSITDVKTLFGLSRKYLIPFLEKLDQEGITIRKGDQRVWRV